VNAVCPACASSRTVPLVPVRLALGAGAELRSHISACRACGHRFLNTTEDEQRQAETVYGLGYHGYAIDPVFARRVREALDVWIVPRQPPPARLLDVGCGNGELLAAAAERGYEVEGIDVSETSAELCRSRGLSARAGDFLSADLGGPFDVLTMWDVVEHLRSPAAFLRRARDLLRPTGLLVLKIPGFGTLSFWSIAVFPRLAASILGAPAHVQYFNAASLEALLAAAGFRRIEWLPSHAFRGRARGGTLKRRLGRLAVRTIGSVARNRTLFLAARC